ncbi:MAG: hypothetical protein A2506_03745 [Elusimicrobia bacterium RIFOXYD12_FULL_66_9]|nr:MAG: hypothetical protein A2506_03745 [Elusimicrobia bacterium RIFOXYD12_FULL_66_9]
MGKVTKVALPHRQALNATIVYTRRAPEGARQSPAAFLRALRGALRMSQADLARRAGVTQSHVARVESGSGDVQLGTLRKLFDAMFCDLLILPRPRKTPGDALAERDLEKPFGRPWAD